MWLAILLTMSTLVATLPLGGGEMQWGISEQELQAQLTVQKVDTQQGSGHGYTDFSEVDPVVYIDRSQANKKVEFYFYKGKLYKTLTIDLSRNNDHAAYQAKITDLSQQLGEPTKKYNSQLFSMTVLHHVWTIGKTEYDVRYGAGYIYEVRTFTPAATEKRKAMENVYAI